MTDTHRFEGVFSYFGDRRPDGPRRCRLPRPLVYTSSDPKRLALAWRWAATSNFQNELRGGFNLAPAHFLSDMDFADGIYTTALGITTRSDFQPQGRYTDTYQLNDNASYLRATINSRLAAAGSATRQSRTTSPTVSRR